MLAIERQGRTDLNHRLTELGYPLASGLQTLRKAISKVEAIRRRQDGTLKLVPGPALGKVKSDMRRYSDEGLPAPPPAPSVPAPEGPITREEFESARPFGLFPFGFSVRRRLISMPREERRVWIARFRLFKAWNNAFNIVWEYNALVSVKGCLALHLHDGVLTLDRAHDDTLKARARFHGTRAKTSRSGPC